MAYNATTTNIFDMPPYFFFSVIGVVFASSLFILLLLKYDYEIPKYTKIFALSGIGLLAGAKLFGGLAGLYAALGGSGEISIFTFLNSGIVFYGGLIGFLLTFLLLCKLWDKTIDYRVVDLAVICIPLFHFWGRLGCFFGGCCYGVENHSVFSILYTNYVKGELVTLSRFPVQLLEASLNIAIFLSLFCLLNAKKLKGHLLIIYLSSYSVTRIILEFFRGDAVRGVWNGISFSQLIGLIILLFCILISIKNQRRTQL